MLFPYKDVNPSRSTPFIVVSLIILNITIFLIEISGGSKSAQMMVWAWGFKPFELFYSNIPTHPDTSPITTIFTSMFLHGGIMHIAGNMLFLWIFGDNVEDFYGHFRFLIFYLTCGAIAALFQAFLNPASKVPMIGASGAISGVMGAYFYLYPHARIRSLFFFFIFIEIIEIPAFFYILIWFAFQLMGVLNPLPTGVAFGAHVGGFLAGLFITKWIYRRRMRIYTVRFR